jgi:hypothetical protein
VQGYAKHGARARVKVETEESPSSWCVP